MNDEQLGKALGSFYKDTDVAPPDPRLGADRVMAEVPDASQVRRRWWLPTFRRNADTEAVMPSTDYQATPIPATNGRSHHAHSPTVLGRTQSMFSPVKAITAGALVFAIGGAFLIAQPFDQQGTSVPGATTDAEFAAPVEVTGTLESGECDSPAHQGVGDRAVLPGAEIIWTCIGPATASDPRLNGTSTFLERGREFWRNGLETSQRMVAGCEADDECLVPVFGLWHAARSIENDGGTWRQRPFVQIDSSGTTYEEQNPVVHVFDGDGDYEGLIAVLEVSGDDAYDFSDASHHFWGYILDARQLRDAPETASAR